MNRLQAITAALPAKGVDGILISNITNVRYLSGFTGSSGFLIITPKERYFITDFRYQQQAEREAEGFEISIVNDEVSGFLVRKAQAAGINVLGVESSVTYAFYRGLLRKGVRLKALTGLVEDIRKIKDPLEMRLIKRAIDRAQRAFLMTKPYIRAGMTETGISGLLGENLKKAGCRTLPFDIIVASGKNGAMPHVRPTGRKIRPGDLVIIDWGGEADGYFSDMTRTLLMGGGNMSGKIDIYNTVLLANMEAIKSVSEGVHARAVDRTARDIIKKAGYGDFFGHGTGHGVGLDVHELPRISRIGRETIRRGMVFTVEPGIYIPGVGGVRIEDMVLAGAGGPSVLTSLSKTPEIIN
ncbi:MAG: aminopeptidase P family protein [Nitrospirae bacterium]|nr:aminopeptidase P family protein [Nitrospirota bacterium]